MKKIIEPEVYYVGIKEPVALRRELLLNSRGLIHSLKKYELFKELRKEKILYVYELRRVMEELSVLQRKLRRALPSSKLQGLEKKQELPKQKKELVQQEINAEKTRLELLESELDKIEERLEELQ